MPKLAREWTEYPPEYMDLLDQYLQNSGKAQVLLASQREANALRQDLYRWFAAINRAKPKFGTDAYKWWMLGRTVMIRTEALSEGNVCLSLIVRPLATLPDPEQWGEFKG